MPPGRDDGGVRVCVLFLLATLIAQQRYFTYASDDDGGRCSLKPWQLDKEYVPDEETEPEDFELWLNDLSTVGHFGSARSRGVYVMSGLEGLNDENWWNTSELHNYDNVENVTASANLSSTAIEVANATTLVNLEAIRTESQPSANKYARENGTATSKYSSDSTTINEERPDEKISENQESADGTSDPGQSKGEKTVEKSESESPSEQAQPESQSEESTQSEGSQSKSSNDDDSSQSRTSAKSICMDPRGLVDDDSDEALYLGSDWTGTDTQKSKVRKLRRWIEADYKDIDVVWIGDSILENWVELSLDTWKHLAKPFKGKVANLGISGAEADFALHGVYDYLSHARLYPKVWVIQLGVNDCFHSERDSPKEIFLNIRDLVRLIQRVNCESAVIVSAILPAGEYKEDWSWEKSPHRQCIKEVNERLKAWAEHSFENSDDVVYIDCGDKYLDENGKSIPKQLSYDAVHPTDKGYQELVGCYREALDKFIARKIVSVNNEAAPNWKQELVTLSNKNGTSPALTHPGVEWMYTRWSNCSASCGLGYQSRSVDCVKSSDGSYSVGCDSSKLLPLTRPCYQKECPWHSWMAGPWDSCSVSCDGGNATREVKCVTGTGIPTDPENCASISKPKEQKECNLGSCGWCGADGKCGGHGTCTHKGCQCSNGWRGSACEVNPSCNGAASKDGCCESGVVSPKGECCKPGSEVDVHGECCPAGMVDACGACGGSGKAVDVHGLCCEGSLDAGGRCCAAAQTVDACGVCDGRNATCGASAVAHVTAPDLSALQVYLDSYLAQTLKAGLSKKDVFVDSVMLSSISLKNFQGPSPAKTNLDASVQIVVLPDISRSSLTAIVDNIQSIQVPESEQHRLKLITEVRYTGVCGNGVCETGEMWIIADPSQGNAPDGTCFRDCVAGAGTSPRGCPADRSGGGSLLPSCSGHGTCIASTGACDCRMGYTGDNCHKCEAGYEPLGLAFSFACTPSTSLGLTLTSESSSNHSPMTVILLTTLAVALSLAVAAALYALWKRTKATRRDKDSAAPSAAAKQAQDETSSSWGLPSADAPAQRNPQDDIQDAHSTQV